MKRRSLIGLLLLLLLAACGDAATPTSAPQNAATPVASVSGGTGDLGKELHIFAWGEYIPDAVVAAFESEFGVNVTVDTYSSNEEMAAKIRAGGSGYDLIQPSDYMVALLAEGGFLAQLNPANLPNLVNLDPQTMGLYYDPNNTYSVPFLWGTTGIAYDTTVFTSPPESWAVLFDPAQLQPYAGRVSMLNDEREVIGAALLYLGKPLNSADAGDLEAAKQLLLAQKPMLAKYNSDNVYQDLASGEVVLAHSWNGYAGLAMLDNPNIGWVIPKEGGVIWQDTVAIVKDAPNPAAAEAFINFLLRPEISAQVADFTGFMTPVPAAEALVGADLKGLYATIKPDDATRQRLDWLRRGENPTAFSDVWSAVKSN